MSTGVCRPLFTISYYFGRVMNISSLSWRLQAYWKPGIMIKEFCPIKFTSRRKDCVPRKAYMDSKGLVEIQKEATKLLKVSTIVPYRPMGGPITKEIEDD